MDTRDAIVWIFGMTLLALCVVGVLKFATGCDEKRDSNMNQTLQVCVQMGRSPTECRVLEDAIRHR